MHRLEIGLQAIQLSPYSAGPAAPRTRTPGHDRRFPGMLWSPSPFGSRSAIRPKNLPPSSSQLRWGYNKAPRGAADLPPSGRYVALFTPSPRPFPCHQATVFTAKPATSMLPGSRPKWLSILPRRNRYFFNVGTRGQPGQQWTDEAVVLIVVGAELPDTYEVPLVEHPAQILHTSTDRMLH